MSDLTPSASAPVVTLSHGHAVTTSKAVADYFGKRHDDVLKAIRALLPDLPAEHARNFAEMLIEIEIGNNATRKSPAYEITRDGFTLLAMGFTGKKALHFKLAYIDAFNRMEEALRTPPVVPAVAAPKSIETIGDLSFFNGDARPPVSCWWAVPDAVRKLPWPQAADTGRDYFAEAARLAAVNERDAYTALAAVLGIAWEGTAGSGWQRAGGPEYGFAHELVKATIVGLRALRNGADPFDPHGEGKGRKAKALGAPKRRALPVLGQIGAMVH